MSESSLKICLHFFFVTFRVLRIYIVPVVSRKRAEDITEENMPLKLFPDSWVKN